MTDNSIPTSRPEADALKEIPEMQTVSPPGEKSLVAGEAAAEKGIVAPTPGESITSLATGTTYNMGPFLGEGFLESCLNALTAGVTI